MFLLSTLAVLSALLIALLTALLFSRIFPPKILSKKVCIIGGTSGLGFELAKLLSVKNAVTITSRSPEGLDAALRRLGRSTVTGRVFNACEKALVLDETFDFIFFCPGLARPGYFKDQTEDLFTEQIETNYLGMIRTLYHFKKCNRRPFIFLVVASTAALLGVPGYGSYAPTKAALKSFFHTVRDELKIEGISLKILYACGMKTRGLKREEESKPAFTKEIEAGSVVEPIDMARYLLSAVGRRDSLAYDWLTYLFMIREECELPVDYLLFPVAVVAVWGVRVVMGQRFRRGWVKR